MYPNQGYPGQYPPFGSGMPQNQMPQPQQMPFGSGYPPQQQQPGFAQMPQPGYQQNMPGYNPSMPQYPQNPPAGYGNNFPGAQNQYGGYPTQQPQNPPMGYANNFPHSQYGVPQNQPAPFGAPQNPPMPFGASQNPPMPAQVSQMPAQVTPQMQGQINQMPGGQTPNFPPQQQSPNTTGIYPQVPTQGNYGGAPYQEQMVQQHQTTSYNAAPSSQTVRRGRPTVFPASNFDASNDAAALRKAMKGFGTDEDALINVLCHRTSDQRVQIVRAYKTAYGKDLHDDIRSETSGNFEAVLIALLTPKTEYYCRELFEAMNGAGTDEDVLIEVMCAMSNAEIREICMLYHRMYGQTLESHLRSDTSGNMKRLMTSLSCGGRDESMRTDVNAARMDAESLKRAGIDRFGTDESEFNRILCLRNYEQLKLICQEYERLTGHPLEKDIKREFSGDIEDALLAIIRVANNRPEFFARRLHKSMAGLGTNDRSLIRLCVTRCEIDMMDIKDEFLRHYSKTLKSFLKGDTSGHYKHALYALCGENRS